MADNNISGTDLATGADDDNDTARTPTDPSPVDPDQGIAQVYPVPDHKHIGVNTELGTDPELMDQGDEEVTREQFGTPDGPD